MAIYDQIAVTPLGPPDLRAVEGEARRTTLESYLQNLSEVVTLLAEHVRPTYGEIYANDAAATITVAAVGKSNKVQIDTFAVNGEARGTTPDHTNDHITIDQAGVYFVTISLSINSTGGASNQYSFSAYVNNGATELPNIHAHHDLATGGAAAGSVSMSGIADLAQGDTLELWAWQTTPAPAVNFIVDDVTLSALCIQPN